MEQTREQEAELLQANEPFITAQVYKLVQRSGKRSCRDIEDLIQEARLAFIKHLRKMDDISQIRACNKDILGAVWDYWVEMAIIRIPRHRYLKEISTIQYISLDDDALASQMLSTDDVACHTELADFLSMLTKQEYIVVLMKLDACSNRSIMPRVGLKTEVQMSRLMKRIREKAAAYLCQ